jgi:hypothetical protein
MSIPAGNEVYRVDARPVRARGMQFTKRDAKRARTGAVAKLLGDEEGKARLAQQLGALPRTQFQTSGLQAILAAKSPAPAWRVGEAFAEAYLTAHHNCSFPWPFERDHRNENASLPGPDSVGFQKRPELRFAFAEAKTSSEKQCPPSVMVGRKGMVHQLKVLRDSPKAKDRLVLYLAHRAAGQEWENDFRKAMERYLEDPKDISLFGVLVRDTAPDKKDLQSRAQALAKGCPEKTLIELRALYVPVPIEDFAAGAD